MVARLADACNVGGSPDVVRHKYEVLRRHCEMENRDCTTIERTNIISPLLARDADALAAKRQRLAVPESYYGFAGTVAQVTDLIGQYRDAGVQLLISSTYKNDHETLELLAADVMPHFSQTFRSRRYRYGNSLPFGSGWISWLRRLVRTS